MHFGHGCTSGNSRSLVCKPAMECTSGCNFPFQEPTCRLNICRYTCRCEEQLRSCTLCTHSCRRCRCDSRWLSGCMLLALRNAGCNSLCRHQQALLDTLPRTFHRAKTLRSCTWCMHCCRRCTCDNRRPLVRMQKAAHTVGCSCLCLHFWSRTDRLQCSARYARMHHYGTSCKQSCHRCTSGSHFSWLRMLLSGASHDRSLHLHLRLCPGGALNLRCWYHRCCCLPLHRCCRHPQVAFVLVRDNRRTANKMLCKACNLEQQPRPPDLRSCCCN